MAREISTLSLLPRPSSHLASAARRPPLLTLQAVARSLARVI